MSMRKAKDRRPSYEYKSVLRRSGFTLARTYKSYNLHFLAKLILVPSSNPVARTAVVGSVSNASEHVAGCHDQRCHDRDGCPRPFALDNGGDEPEEEERA